MGSSTVLKGVILTVVDCTAVCRTVVILNSVIGVGSQVFWF